MKASSRYVFLSLLLFGLTSDCLSAPRSEANRRWNINFNPEAGNPENYYGTWKNHIYNPSPPDWRKETIYRVLTDRFSDGEPANNKGASAGLDLLRTDRRQGGDFSGIINKLDYIRGLGVSTILISPIFQNTGKHYTGESQVDLTLLDNRLGTLAEFQQLVEKAHQRGLYVMVDLILNHLAQIYLDAEPEDVPGLRTGEKGMPFRMHADEYNLVPEHKEDSYKDFNLDNYYYGHGTYHSIYDSTGLLIKDLSEGSYWFSDFHHNGNDTGVNSPWSKYLGRPPRGYDVLRSTHPRVQDKLVAMTSSLISSTDIDGLRVLNADRLPLYFYKRWVQGVKLQAQASGKKNFAIFGSGEDYPGQIATMIGRGKAMPGNKTYSEFIDDIFTLDGYRNWPLYRHLFKGLYDDKASVDLQAAVADISISTEKLDLLHPVYRETRFRMLNSLSHEHGRRLAAVRNGSEKLKLAIALNLFLPGVPLFEQGDEQAFSSYGTSHQGETHESMMTSLAWQKQPAAKKPNPASADNFAMSNMHYLWMQKCLRLRKLYPVLSTGNVKEIALPVESQKQALAFLRSADESRSGILFVFNPGAGKLKHSLKPFREYFDNAEEVTNLLAPAEIYSLSNSDLALTFSAYEIKALAPAQMVQEFPLSVANIEPEHDAIVKTRVVPVAVEFNNAVSIDQLAKSLRFNGSSIAPAKITRDSSKKIFSFEVTARQGINKLEIYEADSKQSKLGQPFIFSSRFRRGTPANVLMAGEPVNDPGLINAGDLSSKRKEVTIYHNAPGASLFRIRNMTGSKWSEWMPYSDTSTWELDDKYPGWQNVTVQYWVDGSSAYFVSDGIDYNPGDVPGSE